MKMPMVSVMIDANTFLMESLLGENEEEEEHDLGEFLPAPFDISSKAPSLDDFETQGEDGEHLPTLFQGLS